MSPTRMPTAWFLPIAALTNIPSGRRHFCNLPYLRNSLSPTTARKSAVIIEERESERRACRDSVAVDERPLYCKL
ncbi:hypothetical protein SCHPADRAFT_526447 [Schizopora paradoxa]|uniref:Uncharacterized protein n=1 Tax=Schizopora paradoxa TaxID=27342 RepID=A0A0H2RZP9_9AGAM|nr:hypothetical protein SCHPADRAFT_526447 [Schizopora paradoxa]